MLSTIEIEQLVVVCTDPGLYTPPPPVVHNRLCLLGAVEIEESPFLHDIDMHKQMAKRKRTEKLRSKTMATHKRVTNRADLAAEYGCLGLHILLLLNSTLCAVYFVFSLSLAI